jgi:membrane-associated phospholipid phosphatase
VRLWVLVALFAGVAVLRSLQVGIPFRDPGGAILRLRVLISLALFVVLALVDAGWRARRSEAGGERLRDVLRHRWPVRRLGLALGALLAYHLVYFSYHNLKSWDSFNHPRDTMLLRWDRRLFLGHSPAVLLHDVLGQHVAAYVLMVVYESFSTLITLAVVAAVVFVDRIRDGYVFIASAVWAWILGVGSYYLIPSLGPFWSAPHEFAGLPHSMVQDTQTRYLAQRAHLLAHPQAADAFAQVSAFASLHVAMTTVILLMSRHYGLRRTSRVLAVFLAATMVATVYFGWHFFVDDLAGLVIAAVAVLLGRTMVVGGSGGTNSGPDGPRPKNWRENETSQLVDADPTPP